MKKPKVVAFLLVAILCAGIAFAGYNVKFKASFSATGTPAAAATAYIPANDGYAIGDTLYVSCETNANMTIYRPQYVSEAYAAVASATGIVVYTTASNTVSGFSPTAGTDYMLVRHTGTSGYQLQKITEVGAWDSTTNITTYGVENAVTCSAKDPIYIIDVDDNLTIPCLAASDQTDLHSMFTGFRKMPVVLTLPATAGTTVIGGTYDVIK